MNIHQTINIHEAGDDGHSNALENNFGWKPTLG